MAIVSFKSPRCYLHVSSRSLLCVSISLVGRNMYVYMVSGSVIWMFSFVGLLYYSSL